MLSDRILSLPEVCELVGLSRWTIRRLRRTRDFPEPLQLTDVKIGWRKSIINAWLDSRHKSVG